MILLVEELKTELVATIKSTEGHRNIRHIRPHIFRKAAPTGSLKVQLRDSSGGLIAESNSVTIASIGSDTYFHGYVKFDLTAQLKEDVTYRVALVPTGGYSFSESNWIGWCNGFDLGKYPGTYTDAEGYSAPLDLELWEYKQVFKGV